MYIRQGFIQGGHPGVSPQNYLRGGGNLGFPPELSEGGHPGIPPELSEGGTLGFPSRINLWGGGGGGGGGGTQGSPPEFSLIHVHVHVIYRTARVAVQILCVLAQPIACMIECRV